MSEKMVGWIAIYNGKRLEISKDECDSLYAAKQRAIAELRVPRSKQGMLAIAPGYEED